MSQFLFQTPAGYLCDYTEQKVLWLSMAAAMTTSLTLVTAFFAQPDGRNLWLMVLVKLLQGAVTAFIPTGLNSITQGIVGAAGMTRQVSTNEMMNHLGTAISVLIASAIAYLLFPNVAFLFLVSPVACVAALWFLNKIRPKDIDQAAARGLTLEIPDLASSASSHSAGSYTPPGEMALGGPKKSRTSLVEQPSFNFGLTPSEAEETQKAETPLQILRDPALLTFVLVIFTFFLAHGTLLPLVMQTLAIGGGRMGIPFSGLCIIIAQMVMVLSAKVCGDYSAIYGRKALFLIGLFSVPVRCLLLFIILRYGEDWNYFSFFVLSTQVLDGIGAGVFGTMYVLVTSDISGGTGRFSLTLGLTSAAVSIGGTFSGYLGEVLAYHLGYVNAFFILMVLSLFPAFLYLFGMPETLPECARVDNTKIFRITSIAEADEYQESEMPTIRDEQAASGYGRHLV